jgi:hypothetical protein
MQNQNFPDGFPMDAQAAIDNSYFLTNEEKSEWTEWLKQANLEQQNELVNTLHDIWIENQKQVVPAGFDTKQSSPVEQVSSQNTTTNSQQAINTKEEQPVVNTSVTSPAESVVPAENTPTTTTQEKVETAPIPVVDKASVTSTVDKTTSNVTDEPVITRQERQPQSNRTQDKTQPASRTENRTSTSPSATTMPAPVSNPRNDNTQRSSQNPQNQRPQRSQEQVSNNDRNRDRNQNRNDRNYARNEERQSNISNERTYQNNAELADKTTSANQATQKPFNLTSARAVATNEELTKLVQTYQLQQKSLQAARLQYEESLQKKEAQTEESFLTLMTRSIEILSQFEGVTDYISGMQEKLLKMNEIVIQQSKENSETRNEIRSEVIEIKDNYDRIERDSSSNYRDLKDFKTETRRTMQDLLAQQNTKTVDAYEGQGIKGQLELLEAKIALLEKKLEQSQTNTNISKREPIESRKYEKPQIREPRQPIQNVRTAKPDIEEPQTNSQEEAEIQQAPQQQRPQQVQQPRQQNPRQQNSRIQKPQRPERPARTEEKPREVVQEESVIDLSDLI